MSPKYLQFWENVAYKTLESYGFGIKVARVCKNCYRNIVLVKKSLFKRERWLKRKGFGKFCNKTLKFGTNISNNKNK